MNTQLNVSAGRVIEFAADGVPVSGVVVRSEMTSGMFASIIVRIDSEILEFSQLTIPSMPECGGIGQAQVVKTADGVFTLLSIGYSYVDMATIGK